MTILKVTTASFLIATAFSVPANAGRLGGLGGAIGNVTSGVGNAVGNVASGVSDTVDHVTGGGRTGASAAGSASASSGGISADVGVDVGVGGIAAVSLCAGVNSTKGCGGETASAVRGVSATRSVPSARTRATEQGGATSLRGSPDWLVGLMAIGSDGKVLGMIDKASTSRQQQMPTITVQLANNRKVQLKNAISAINTEGVWLVVPATAVDNRATGRMTKLSIQ